MSKVMRWANLVLAFILTIAFFVAVLRPEAQITGLCFTFLLCQIALFIGAYISKEMK